MIIMVLMTMYDVRCMVYDYDGDGDDDDDDDDDVEDDG